MLCTYHIRVLTVGVAPDRNDAIAAGVVLRDGGGGHDGHDRGDGHRASDRGAHGGAVAGDARADTRTPHSARCGRETAEGTRSIHVRRSRQSVLRESARQEEISHGYRDVTKSVRKLLFLARFGAPLHVHLKQTMLN